MHTSLPPDHAVPLILFGAGSHARSVISTLVDIPGWQLVGLINTSPEVPLTQVLGFPVLGDESVLPGLLASGVRHIHVCLDDNRQRAEASQRLQEQGFTLATLYHPRAMRSPGSAVGEGSLVQAGVLLSSEFQAGAGCIFHAFISLGHGTLMGDYVQLEGGVITGGDCVIGSYTHIGMGATLLPRLRIGQHVVIGAKAVVREDVPDYAVVEGNPGRVVALREVNQGLV